MPACDVGDFSDVVDAINRLCDTMKTSQYARDDTETDSANDSVNTFSTSEEMAICADASLGETAICADASLEETAICADAFLEETAICADAFLEETAICADTSLEESNVSVVPVQYEDAAISLESAGRDDISIYHEAETAWSTSLERTSSRDDSLDRCGTSIGEEEPLLSNESFTHEVPHKLLEAMYADVVSPEASFGAVEVATSARNWSESTVSLPATSEVACEPASEMYYTASSEVSLLSDIEIPVADRAAVDDDSLNGRETSEERKDCVIAGHVAAMRERFESMTRTNTPCPDLARSASPSLDVFRNITPSPDRLG